MVFTQKELLRKLSRNKRGSARQRERLMTDLEFTGVISKSDRHLQRVARANPLGKDNINQGPVFVPLKEVGDEKALTARLTRGGIPLPYPHHRRDAVEHASKVKIFDRAAVYDRAGWFENTFVFQDGDVRTFVAPEDDRELSSSDPGTLTKGEEVAFYPGRRGLQNGSLNAWRKGLKSIIRDQDLLLFAISMGLVPQLLPWTPVRRFAVEIVGPEASGKTTLAALAAACSGQPWVEGQITPFHRATTGLFVEDHLASHADHLLVLDGADRFFATHGTRERLGYLREIDNALSGQSEESWGSELGSRCVVLSTSRQSIVELSGDAEEGRLRLGGDLLTLCIPNRPFGIFRKLPVNCRTSGDAIAAVNEAIMANHGVATRAFVTAIGRRIAADEPGFEARIRECIAHFVTVTNVDQNNGPALRQAQRFGVAYAAALLAAKCGCIGRGIDVKAALLRCWMLFNAQPNGGSISACLKALASNPDTIDLGEGPMRRIGEAEREKALAYIRTIGGVRQLLIPKDLITIAIPDWPRRKASGEVRNVLIVEQQTDASGELKTRKLKVGRKLGGGRKQELVFAFRLD